MNNRPKMHKIILTMLRRYNRPLLLAGLAAAFALVLFYIISGSVPPGDFPQKEIVTIKPGTYLSQAADILVQRHIIKSAFLFKVYVVLISGHRQVQAGDYLFD